MLVLSRKAGERIVLPGSGIVITVTNIQGSRVKLGIEAPPEVPIQRAELLERSSGSMARGRFVERAWPAMV